MEPGGGPEPNTPKPAGSAVEFNYSLRAPAFENKLVEAGAACKATLKTGALAPELDALLDAVGTKGKARCKVGIPWQGSAAPADLLATVRAGEPHASIAASMSAWR